ncbi:DUF5110 domain-containing protein, partial [Lutibacter sp.]|uniref:glycoside hydrolase family 31 protein n=1 Tax=Lutibacter sp. TaxID=1925666 RepID=UPI003569A0E9
YTLAFENNQKGLPLMRPLFFEKSNDKSFLINDKTYLWGNDFLISPVMKPSLKEQEVYFPSNSNWFNFYTEEKIKGGQTKIVSLNKESIPTYVRGGAFIPIINQIQHTQQYNLNSFNLHFYFDKEVTKSESNLYNDDGETPNAYEKEMYEMFHFKSNYKKGNLTIKIKQERGVNYQFTKKKITLIVHHVSKKPKKVKGYNFTWNAENKILFIPIEITNSSNKIIQIKL